MRKNTDNSQTKPCGLDKGLDGMKRGAGRGEVIVEYFLIFILKLS